MGTQALFIWEPKGKFLTFWGRLDLPGIWEGIFRFPKVIGILGYTNFRVPFQETFYLFWGGITQIGLGFSWVF